MSRLRPRCPRDDRRDGGGAHAGRGGERGAVLVHAAVAMMGLLAFSALTIDMGTLWVARAQAQNAVDAAALSGGVSLAYVNPTDLDAARAAAQAVVQVHTIWGDAITPESVTMTVGDCPAGAPAVTGECVRVAVERGGGAGAPLPVFFSRLFGAGATTLRASASSKVMLGNATSCLRPWAIPDRWLEVDGTWAPNDRYQAYVPGTSTPLPGAHDTYVPLGYDLGLVGTRLQLNRADFDHPGVDGDAFSMLDMPNAETDHERRYEVNIATCNPMPVAVGDSIPLTRAHPASTLVGVTQLVASDPLAYWDGTTVRGSEFSVSPRIVAMAVYDPDALAAQGVITYDTPVVVRNIIGFFVQDFEGDVLRGVVVPMAGNYNPDRPSVAADSGFLRTLALVR